jgi:hypothetical protein
MYFKVTSAGNLTATRTLTIAPNTVSRVMFIENATSGSQSIAISQGSGANVTIATGKTAVVYLDGAGSGAAVVDAMALVDPGVTDTLAEVLTAGNTTTTDQKVQFRDSAIYINSSADGQLDLVADTEIQIAATTVDINGNLDVSGTTVSAGKITADAGIDIDNINIDGTTIALSSGDLTLDVAGDIILDADGGDFKFRDGGAGFFTISNSSLDAVLKVEQSDEDFIIKGNDGGSEITAVTLDMSAAGAATFNSSVTIPTIAYVGTSIVHQGDTNTSLDFGTDTQTFFAGGARTLDLASGSVVINDDSADIDFRVESNDNANMLFIDGVLNKVGIGVVPVQGALTIKSGGNTYATSALVLEDTDSTTRSYITHVNGDLAISNNGSTDQLLLKTSGALIVGGAVASTNIELNLNGVASKAQRIQFQEGGVNKWLLGQGAASETSAFELYNAGGVIALSVDRTSNIATFQRGAVFNEGGADSDFRVESDGNTHALFVDAGNDVVNIGTSGLSATGVKLAVQGPAIFNTDTGTNKVYISRSGDTNQTGSMYTDDATFIFDSIQDEAGSGFGGFLFRGTNATTANAKLLEINQTGAVFNEDGADMDFRVESDGNDHALFVDASAGTVAINTSTLTHAGSTAGSLVVNGGSTSATTPIMMVIDGDGTVEGGSTLLECNFAGDTGFSASNYVQFRDLGGVQGTISGTGDGTVAYNTSSDERLKQNIQDTDSKWDLVKSLQVRDYEWKKSGKQDTGFIAQELHDKWAQPVKVGGEDVINDPWSVDYGKLTPILTKALQEAMEKIETLEARIAALES